ncbi:MAG TPA: pseudouridine synthase [Opitutaceae bacterium]
MEPVRIQKYLADLGLCSRRAAEAMIAAGEVHVNGERPEPGRKVDPSQDRITIKGRTVGGAPQQKVTVAVHKPRGFICSNSDPAHSRTVFDLLPRPLNKLRFFCAGRLDLDSEGLVILTTDGELANRLMHPSSVVVKRYQVALKQPIARERLPLLIRGIVIEGERLKVERAYLLNANRAGESTGVEVHMHHGKKREIRGLFTALGYDVERLRRYQIGRLVLRGIPLRGVRVLGNREIESLFATEESMVRRKEPS